MTTHKVTVPLQDAHTTTNPRSMQITLPGPPFPTGNREETAPRMPMVKGNHNWKRDPELSKAAWLADKGRIK